MIVNLQQYGGLATIQGVAAPIGGEGAGAGETLTAAGDFAALDDGAKLVRIATDTAIYFSLATGADGTGAFLPAGAVEFFAVVGGETCSIAAA